MPSGDAACGRSSTIIPYLPIRAGRVAPLAGITTLRDPGDPLELARHLDDRGASRLFVEYLDQDDPVEALAAAVRQLVAEVRCPVLVSIADGSLRSPDEVHQLLELGAQRVAINTSAVRHPGWVNEITTRFGAESLLAVIRARRVTADWWEPMISHGAEATGLDAISWAYELVERGVGELLVHSIDRAGHGWGFDLDLTRAIADAVPAPVIASGGAALPQDLVAGLTKGGASAVVVDELVHTGRCSLETVNTFVSSWFAQLRGGVERS